VRASTFLNAQQTDYEKFATEARDIVAFVKKQASEPSKESPQSEVSVAHSAASAGAGRAFRRMNLRRIPLRPAGFRARAHP
jgi:hypothetical protein